ERCSSISFASLRASSTGWTLVLKARPKTPSKRRSSLCSIARSTCLNLPGVADAKRRDDRDCDGARCERGDDGERCARRQRENRCSEHPRAEAGAPAEAPFEDIRQREGDGDEDGCLEEKSLVRGGAVGERANG